MTDDLKAAVEYFKEYGRTIGNINSPYVMIHVQTLLTHATRQSEMVEVYLVIVCRGDDERFAMFSSKEKATEWAERQGPSCVIVPYVIDEPDYGNVRGN